MDQQHPFDRQPELYEMPDELYQKEMDAKLTGDQYDKLHDEWWNNAAPRIRAYQADYPKQKESFDLGKRAGVIDKNAHFLTPEEFKTFQVDRHRKLVEAMQAENMKLAEHAKWQRGQAINNKRRQRAADFNRNKQSMVSPNHDLTAKEKYRQSVLVRFEKMQTAKDLQKQRNKQKERE